MIKMTKPDFIKARNKASEILLLQEDLSFPIDVEKIKLNDKKIIFSDYENYAKKVGIKIEELSCNGQFEDAMVIDYKSDLKVILYNSNVKSKARILWSKAHELGHIVLGHTCQGDKEEVEANTFAAQLLLPQCLLKKLFNNHIEVTPTYIMNKFGLSKIAAEKSLKQIGSKLENEYDAEYDDLIIYKCSQYIKEECKNNVSSQYYDINEERNNWLYDL